MDDYDKLAPLALAAGFMPFEWLTSRCLCRGYERGTVQVWHDDHGWFVRRRGDPAIVAATDGADALSIAVVMSTHFDAVA